MMRDIQFTAQYQNASLGPLHPACSHSAVSLKQHLDNVHNSNTYTVQDDNQSADVSSAYITKMKQEPCVKDIPTISMSQPSPRQNRCAADEIPSKTSLAQSLRDSANQKYFSSTLLLQIMQEK